MRFHNKLRDYIRVSTFGLLAAILSLLTALLPYDSLWSIPSITTLYGFWIVSCALLIWRSTSHIIAGLNVFLYLFFTTLAFFGLKFILGFFLPQFDNGSFPTRLFLYYTFVSLICGVVSVVLYCWNHNGWYSAILLALPIGVLAAETITVLTLLQNYHTHLFQLIFNAGFCLYLGLQFRKMTKFKELYTVSVIGVAAFSYHFIY